MITSSRRLFAVLACACAIAPTTLLAQPADWPARPIRVIVPAPAGGPFDRTMRPLAQHMGQILKQPMVVDNRPSAGNIVGTQAGATATPDGYTLTMTGMLNAVAQGMYENVPFDITRDFEHIGVIGEGPQWLVVRSDAGFSSFADLVQQAKKAPGTINYASSGAGSSGHLVMEQLQRTTGIQLTHVPYKGGAPALQDVLAGVVSIIMIPQNAAAPGVQSGKLKVLAITSKQRNSVIPDVPTFVELNLPQLTVNTCPQAAWVGISAPKGTPEAIVRKLNSALQQALKDPTLLKQLEFEGIEPLASTPEQYTRLVRSETDRWGQLVRSLNIKAN